MNTSPILPVVLSIAGSDSSGGAGIQADLRAFAANGVYGTTALTCLTAQNPDGVSEVFPVAPEFVLDQVRQVDRFFPLRSIKTGMLFSAEIIRETGAFLEEKRDLCPAVVDPVMVATSGAVLLQSEAVAMLRECLLPHAALITPNLDEAAVLLGERPEADTMPDAAVALAREFGVAVLLKGGHLLGNVVWDVLGTPEGPAGDWKEPRIGDVDTHGSGCTLASAIAAHLAQGRPLKEAVGCARAYLRRGMQQAVAAGPRSFINHFPREER